MRLSSFFIIFITTLFVACTQFVIKYGINNKEYWIVFFGILFYGVNAVLFMWGLRGGKLSTHAPVLSLTLVWVSLGAFLFFGEALSFFRIIGIASIITGLFFLFNGGRK